VHHLNDRTRTGPRPARCLRHHVWMAACGDCRDAHTAPVRDLRETGPASR
jgi:hypothetical protein